jgi:hypothetical protein
MDDVEFEKQRLYVMKNCIEAMHLMGLSDTEDASKAINVLTYEFVKSEYKRAMQYICDALTKNFNQISQTPATQANVLDPSVLSSSS